VAPVGSSKRWADSAKRRGEEAAVPEGLRKAAVDGLTRPGLDHVTRLAAAGGVVDVIQENLARVLPRPVMLPLSAPAGQGVDRWIAWLQEYSTKSLQVSEQKAKLEPLSRRL